MLGDWHTDRAALLARIATLEAQVGSHTVYVNDHIFGLALAPIVQTLTPEQLQSLTQRMGPKETTT
jgi:hypothetical protein